MLITKELLLSKRACSSQVELFESTFPSGAKVTKENCLLAAKVGLDFNWAARHLLSASQQEIYDESTEQARKIYSESRTQALKIYDESTVQAGEIYNESKAQAYKIYYEFTAQAWKIYSESCAQAFYHACK